MLLAGVDLLELEMSSSGLPERGVIKITDKGISIETKSEAVQMSWESIRLLVEHPTVKEELRWAAEYAKGG